jgi:hypothetical protein
MKIYSKAIEQLKKRIEQEFNNGVKPKRILERLREDDFSVENKFQITNYLSLLRARKYGPSKISLGELEHCCNDHTSIPVDEDVAYVVKYFIKSLHLNWKLQFNTFVQQPSKYRTSKRCIGILLNNSKKSFLCLDSRIAH